MKKYWLRSVTMRGLIIAVAGTLFGYVGFEIPALSPLLDFVVHYLDGVLQLAGALIIAYDQWKAAKSLSSSK